MGSSIPLPALDVKPPENPLEQYGRLVSLQNLMRQGQQQQALMPGQIQLQQGAAQAQQQENQIRALHIKSQQAMMDEISQGNLNKFFGSEQAKDKPGGFDAPGMYQYLVSKQILPDEAGQVVGGYQGILAKDADTLKNLGAAGVDQQKQRSNSFDEISNRLASIKQMTDPSQQQTAIRKMQLDYMQHPPPGIRTDELAPFMSGQLDPSHLDFAAGLVGIGKKVADAQAESLQKQAAATKAGQEADIVTQLSKPEALASPGAQAAIQQKIQDPATDPKDIPRLEALLPKAGVAQDNALRLKTRELAAQQAISQGDPDAAGKLLASRSLTIDELKLRNATPQFMERAVQSAQKYDPTFKAPEAAAQGKIAASAPNQQFFGNTDSLLVRGGTLDQLNAAGRALGNSQIPKYNTLANWAKAAVGSGPQAAFAAKALGVADDYSKVMTGSGQGSDTSRQQALDIISRDLSPAGREAAIQAIRETVGSQRQGRIGTNPYLRDMYPDPQAGATNQPANQAPNFTPQTHQFSSSAWKRANPSGDVKAAEAAARAQNFNVVP